MTKIFALVRLSFYVAISLLLFACSEQKFEPLTPGATIVAFGDSLTDGVGASKGQGYPEVLAKLSGLSVINSGISGETTSEGLERLPSVLEEHQPDLVILIEGGNDILRNSSHAAAKSNLAAMIELIQQSGADLVFIGVPEKNLFSNSADFYDELAEEYDLVYDGESLSDLLKTRSYKSDSVHLNNEGYRELATRIYHVLQDQGAL